MSKKTKIWLVLATILVICGAIIFCVTMSKHKWDFTKLITVKFETNTYEINEEFCDVLIDATITDVTFIPSEDNTCKVICNEMEKVKHTVLVSDNKLTITANDERKWYDHINIVNSSPKITVYLPDNNLESFNLDGSTGNVNIENISIKTINISLTTGKIKLNNIQCNSLYAKGSTGDVQMNNVVVTNTLLIERSTGDIQMNNVSCNKLDIKISTGKTELTNVLVTTDFTLNGSTGDVLFDSFDALNIYVDITTGDVKGTILTEKIFNAKSGTGKVNVPETYSGGVCKVRTSTGNIILSYKK